MQRQWPLGPRAQGGLAHSQGTSRQPPHGCSITFALQEKAPRPRPVCTILGSCRENTLGAYLDPRPRAPNWHFSHGEPLRGAAQQLLAKVSHCCLFPSARTSFAPQFGIWQASATPCWGPMGGARCPWPGEPSMAPGPLRCTHTASFPMGRTAVT